MAATNRTAVLTTVKKEFAVNFVDINKAIALISDVTTIGTEKKLYAAFSDVEQDWLATDPFYKMAKAFFDEGGNQLYAVPLADTLGNANITGKLGELENDATSGFGFVAVIMDKVIGVADQVVDGTLVAYAFDKTYHVFVETAEANILTATTPNTPNTNKLFYDGLTGDDFLKIGNMSMVYTPTADDYICSGLAGIFLSKDIGTKTAKFKKPKNSSAVSLTNGELTNILNVNTNVYTGTNEPVGRSFIKEGTTLKDGDFIDTSLGAIWVKVQLDNALYDFFQATDGVPINATGFAQLENVATAVFQKAQDQGIIDSNAITPFSITFAADPSVTRGILGTYTYVDTKFGHFITNTVTLVQGA